LFFYVSAKYVKVYEKVRFLRAGSEFGWDFRGMNSSAFSV